MAVGGPTFTSLQMNITILGILQNGTDEMASAAIARNASCYVTRKLPKDPWTRTNGRVCWNLYMSQRCFLWSSFARPLRGQGQSAYLGLNDLGWFQPLTYPWSFARDFHFPQPKKLHVVLGGASFFWSKPRSVATRCHAPNLLNTTKRSSNSHSIGSCLRSSGFHHFSTRTIQVCHGQGCRYTGDGKNPTFNRESL